MRATFFWVFTRLFPSGWGVHRAGQASVTVIVGPGYGVGGINFPVGLLTGIAIAYGAVIMYFATRFVWRWIRLTALRRDSVEIKLTGEAAVCWAECSERFGIEDVSIAASSRISGPVSMGIARKLVMLPANMVDGLTGVDLHTVIAHEFAHLYRNDFLKNLIYEAVSLPVNYHPLVWLTKERIMESREIVCDQMAAELSGRKEYARSLLRLAALLVKGMPVRTPHAIGIFDANVFERRLMKLTKKQDEIRGLRGLAVVAACAVFGIGTCWSAVALSMHVVSSAADKGASSPNGPVAVSAGVMAGNKISGPVPVYPPEAKKAKIQGTVELSAVIGKDGTVEKLEVVSGPKELQQSSLDAVRQWVYKPYLLNGEPIEVKTTINVIYSLVK
jgi:TonB family protein